MPNHNSSFSVKHGLYFDCGEIRIIKATYKYIEFQNVLEFSVVVSINTFPKFST